MIIDIEALHETIEQESLWRSMPRTSGRTFAMSVQAVQSADVLRDEYSSFLVMAEYPNMVAFLQTQAIDIAKSLGIDCVSSSSCIKFGQSTIYFIRRADLMKNMRGQKLNNVYIDHYTKALTENEISFIQTRLI